MPANAPVYVTKPYLPPLQEFIPYLESIWEKKILTNFGPFHEQLEQQLAHYLGIEHISLFTNATIALVTALQALRVTGEVITTPYSFVATSHALLWNSVKPVFVDIDAKTLNMDPAKIEAAITPQTTAILPVHCYGHPCDVAAIRQIAETYNLKLIYDAAHAFGVRDEGGSILRHGDMSVVSFHATKVFNTFEGGAIICPDAKSKAQIDRLKNFGHAGEIAVVAPGINGKMSEFNAALGLLQLKHIDRAIFRRGVIAADYRARLKNMPGIRVLDNAGEKVENFAYFPVFVENGYPLSRDELYAGLKEFGVNTRRYFYPLISEFPMYRGLPSAQRDRLPVATEAARKILCLPIYPDLEDQQIEMICNHIAAFARQSQAVLGS